MNFSAVTHDSCLAATGAGVGALMALTADNHGETLIEGSRCCWWLADGHVGQDEQQQKTMLCVPCVCVLAEKPATTGITRRSDVLSDTFHPQSKDPRGLW